MGECMTSSCVQSCPLQIITRWTSILSCCIHASLQFSEHHNFPFCTLFFSVFHNSNISWRHRMHHKLTESLHWSQLATRCVSIRHTGSAEPSQRLRSPGCGQRAPAGGGRPPPPPPPYSRSTFYVNDPSKARPTPTWLHSATLIRESVLAGISVTGTYLSEVPQSFLRIGYVLETRGPGWGVRPSPGCWRQERRGEDGDFPPHSAGWEPGPGAHTPQEGHQRRLQALSRSPVHLLPDPPHPRRARGPGWQHAWGEVCLSCCGACWINLWTPSCHVFPALLALLHCLQDVCLKSHQTSEKMISSIFLKCITICKTVLLDHFRKQKLLLYNQFSFGEGEIQTQIWIQIQIIIFTISTR